MWFTVAERVLYTPSIGYCLFVGLLLEYLFKQSETSDKGEPVKENPKASSEQFVHQSHASFYHQPGFKCAVEGAPVHTWSTHHRYRACCRGPVYCAVCSPSVIDT